MNKLVRTVSRSFGLVLPIAALLSAAAMAADAPPAAPSVAEQPGQVQQWDKASARQLLDYIAKVGTHGLDPEFYAPYPLSQAIEKGNAEELERSATQSFAFLARDLASGHVRPGERARYYIASDPVRPDAIADLIDLALIRHDVAGTLESLAPKLPQYARLRAELAALPGERVHERQSLKVNLERLRWLPRALGERYILVNIPEYALHLVDKDSEIASHRVIVGKPQTPTPQFSAEVQAVVLNPSWHVPQSIVAETVGELVRSRPSAARAQGYQWKPHSDGRLEVTQAPGPKNALGQMKLDMPNPLSVYIHDTPAKTLFARDERAFSHGCIRTADPFDLAATLLAASGWTRKRIDGVVAAKATSRIPLARSIPVYVVYLTAIADKDGRVRYLGDPYRRDGGVYQSLGGGELAQADEAPLATECRNG